MRNIKAVKKYNRASTETANNSNEEKVDVKTGGGSVARDRVVNRRDGSMGKEKAVNGKEHYLSTCAGAAVNQAFLVQAIPTKMCKC